MTRSTLSTLAIADNAITTAKLPADFSNGITFYETMRLTSNLSAGTGGDISGTFESADTGTPAKKLISSTGMSASSGIFTFPATGMYLLLTGVRYYADADISYNAHTIKASNDNFSSNDIEVAQVFSSWGKHEGSNNYEAMHCQYMLDCTNTSTHKFKMRYSSTGTITVAGNTDANETYVTVIRVGDT